MRRESKDGAMPFAVGESGQEALSEPASLVTLRRFPVPAQKNKGVLTKVIHIMSCDILIFR